MKKNILILSILTLSAINFSCKKEYTCVCTGNSSSVEYEKNIQIKATPSNADAECAAQSSTAYGVTTTCQIKE